VGGRGAPKAVVALAKPPARLSPTDVTALAVVCQVCVAAEPTAAKKSVKRSGCGDDGGGRARLGVAAVGRRWDATRGKEELRSRRGGIRVRGNTGD
jgi:hypothetical protein